MKFTLKQLQIFVAVAERLHVTQTADALFMSPPAVTKQIKQLEVFVGGKLFYIIGKQLHLTDLAVRLLPFARSTLAEAAVFAEHCAAADVAVEPVKLHIGCLLYTSPSPRDGLLSRMPSSA